jgi:drug/metabolite transporter (DMT)-like permease
MVMFLTIGLGSIPLAAAAAGPEDLGRFTGSLQLWILLGLLATFSTLLPFVLMNRYQRQVSASEAGVIYGAEPVLASLLSLYLPAVLSLVAGIRYDDERLSMRLLVGAILVTAAALLLRARAAPSEAHAVDEPELRHAPD